MAERNSTIEGGSDSLLYLGIDVGGTLIKSGIVNGAGVSLLPQPVRVPVAKGQSSKATLGSIRQIVHNVLQNCRLKIDAVSACCVAWPGRVNPEVGIVVEHVNLNKAESFPSQAEMAEILGLPVVYENDANAAAWAEFWVGVGKNVNSLVLLTLGTGIGSGIILEGRIHRGLHGLGAELGHIEINVQHEHNDLPPACCCGRVYCLENFASCSALVRRAEEALKTGVSTALREKWDETPHEKRARLIDVLRAEGDPFCLELMRETAHFLAQGTADIMNALAPELICFGGGMSNAGEDFIGWIRDEVYEVLPLFKDTKICRAELGGNAGYIGAAGCAAQHFRENA